MIIDSDKLKQLIMGKGIFPAIISNAIKTAERAEFDDDFESILICAVRYAIGRQMYMPSTVCSYITPLLPRLSSKALCVLKRDIVDAEKYGYGDEKIDKPVWINFLSKIQGEIERRNCSADNEQRTERTIV